jgi:hypothetical protein
MSRTFVTTAAVGVAVACVAAGCGGAPHDPPVSSFRMGYCRTAAPTVLAVGRVARGALSHDTPRVSDVIALTTAQHRLEAAERATPAGRAPLTPLVTAIGLYRLHVVGHTVSREVTQQVVAAQHEVVTRCVARQSG